MRSHARIVGSALIALLLIAVAVAGCTKTDAVASVNGAAIDSNEVDRQLDAFNAANGGGVFDGPDGEQRKLQMKGLILETLIQQELLRQAGEELGIKVTDAQVDERIKALEDQYGGAEGLDEALKQSGVTRAQLKDSIRNQLLREAIGDKVAKVSVTDEQIKAYYEENKDQFLTKPLVHLAHVLVADKATADEVVAQLNKGADIAGLAEKYSIDQSTKDKGGDLDWAVADKYPPEIQNAALSMKPGEVRVVQVQDGWHVMKLIDSKPGGQKTLEEATPTIRQILVQQAQTEALTKYIDELEKKANIQILDAGLKSAVDEAAKANTAGSGQ